MHATATGHWEKGFEKLPAADLFLLEEQVNELVAMPGWERIVSWIGSGHAAVLKSLTQGATKPHADQSRIIGYLAGLEEAPNVVKAISKVASRKRQELEERAAVADRARTEGHTP